MASVIDICNIALARLGQEADISSISPPEGGHHAEQCARWYPISRDKALASFPWSFATRTVELPQLAASPIVYKYAYKVPADCIRILDVFNPQVEKLLRTEPVYEDFAWMTQDLDWAVQLVDGVKCVVTDMDIVAARYTVQQTDTAAYSPAFTDALSWLLASDLAGPIHTGATGIKLAGQCYQAYQTALEYAKMDDVRQQNIRFKVRPRMQGDYHG